jgi:excisionase family DNA binding protein
MDERIPGQAPEQATRPRASAVDVRRERQRPHTGLPSPTAALVSRPWPPLLTVAEVAELLRTSPKAVYAMAERGQLPGLTRIGRRLLVSGDALKAFLEESRERSRGRTPR